MKIKKKIFNINLFSNNNNTDNNKKNNNSNDDNTYLQKHK